MTRKPVLLAFVAGCAATAALAWVIGDVRAADAPFDPVINVCAAPDGVLRLVAAGSPCPPGQRQLHLRKAESHAKGPKEDKESATKPDAAADRKLADLERRVDGLERQESGGELAQTVRTPFKVVDRAGKTVLEVDSDETGGVLMLRNSQGKANVRMHAGDSGGYFYVISSDRKLATGIGAQAGTADFRVTDVQSNQDMDKPRVLLGRSEKGDNYRLLFKSSDAKPVAALGERVDRPSGLLYVYDAQGKERVALGVSDEKQSGYVAVLNPETKAVAVLAQGNAGGLLDIYGPKGDIMVEAGVVAPGFGVVRAGPEGFKPGAGLLGLPGSYIAGKPN